MPAEKAARGRATAEMVARAANVSRVAVSRAFNPAASIKPEKRALILRVAGELNYTPDRAARALVTRRSHLIGVIVPDVCSPWESQEIDALTTALQDEGFATVLFKTRTDLSMDETLLTYIRGFNLESIVVFVENVRPRTIARVLDRAVPIYVNYPGANGATALDQPPCDRLTVEIRPGIEQAVTMMAGYGARRIAYLGGVTRSLANAAREETLRRVIADLGLDPPVLLAGDWTYDTAHAATLRLFRVDHGADAIFAANDVGAFGALDALRHDLGLRVPEDVMVAGFDDIAQSHWKSYDLTTVRVDLDERVRALVRLMLRRLREPDAPPLQETISTRLIVRRTVGTNGSQS